MTKIVNPYRQTARAIGSDMEQIGRERIPFYMAIHEDQDYVDMTERYPHAMVLNPGRNKSKRNHEALKRLAAWAALGLFSGAVWFFVILAIYHAIAGRVTP